MTIYLEFAINPDRKLQLQSYTVLEITYITTLESYWLGNMYLYYNSGVVIYNCRAFTRLNIDKVVGRATKSSYLDRSRRAELVESAFRDLGEDPRHRVLSVFRLLLGHGEHVCAVLRELAPEEEIHEVNLTDDVDQVQELAQEELHRVELKRLQGSLSQVHR